MQFQNEDELEEWLSDLDYDGFWAAMALFPNIDVSAREICDRQIAEGSASKEDVLMTMKIVAQIRIAEAQDLLPRIIDPEMSLH